MSQLTTLPQTLYYGDFDFPSDEAHEVIEFQICFGNDLPEYEVIGDRRLNAVDGSIVELADEAGRPIFTACIPVEIYDDLSDPSAMVRQWRAEYFDTMEEAQEALTRGLANRGVGESLEFDLDYEVAA